MANELKKLEKREGFLRDSLINLSHLAETYCADRDMEMLEGWRERLEEIFLEFSEVRLKLECSDEYENKLKRSLDASAIEQSQRAGEEIDPQTIDEANQETRANFELTYLRLKGFISNKLRTHATNLTPTIHTMPASTLRARVKLPEIKLPTFDGSIKDWPSFRDTFKSLIDSNPVLGEVEKFSYLVASLSTEAKRVIEVIDITAANYTVAWSLLVQKYENKYLLVKSYVESLFAVETMKKECSESLSHLIDDFERNLKMLEKVGEVPDNWSTILVFMLSSRLDPTTLRYWETHRKSTTVPTYTNLIEFLRSHVLVLQSIATSKSSDSSRSSPSQRPHLQSSKLSTVHSAVSPKNSCPFCKKAAHSPYSCEVFRKLTPTQRYEEAKKIELCTNCLASNSHTSNSCSGGTCRVCHQKHHTMLHPATSPNSNQSNQSSSSDSQSSSSPIQNQQSPTEQSNQQGQSTAESAPPVPAPSTSHISLPAKEPHRRVPATVLLSTALVKVFDSANHFVWARAMLDSGSELNFVSEHLAQQLNLHRTYEFVPINGIGMSSTASNHSTMLRIQSHRADFEDNWKFHVLPEITMELPSEPIDVSKHNWPSEVVLADPSFNKPGRIDLIFGVQVFYDLLRDGQIQIGSGEPTLQNTALGWLVSGRVGAGIPRPAVVNIARISSQLDNSKSITDRIWSSLGRPIERSFSNEELEERKDALAAQPLPTNEILSLYLSSMRHGGRRRCSPPHLRSTAENVALHRDDFPTLLTQIEACLNSRPVTQSSSNPNDLELLSLEYFLAHRALKAILEPSLKDVPSNRPNRCQPTQETTKRDNVQFGTQGRYRRAISTTCVPPINQPDDPTSDDESAGP